jgi:hypothetical protein
MVSGGSSGDGLGPPCDQRHRPARSGPINDDLLAAVQGGCAIDADAKRLVVERLEQIPGLVAEILHEQLVDLVGVCGCTRSSSLRNSRESGSPNAPGLDAMI